MGFEVLLGMDWSTEHEVILDCIVRSVEIKNNIGKRIKICCEEPNELMRSFLYSLDMAKDKLGAISVVCNYTDIFDELRGLPPHREVEFFIDLVLDIGPIIQSLRRMAPKEEKELGKKTRRLLSYHKCYNIFWYK